MISFNRKKLKTYPQVLETFIEYSNKSIEDSTIDQSLGMKEKDKAKNIILETLQVKDFDLVFTSDITESNNLAISGVLDLLITNKPKILVGSNEHPSITKTIQKFQKQGAEVETLVLNKEGRVNMRQLRLKLESGISLVSLSTINDDYGVIQPVEKIAELVSLYPETILHFDASLSLGKYQHRLENIDLISFSEDNFGGIAGMGGLLVKKGTEINPQMLGDFSESIYRAGEPPLPLMMAMATALQLSYQNLPDKLNDVAGKKEYLINKLKSIANVTVEEGKQVNPYVVFISATNMTGTAIQKQLMDYDIYVDTIEDNHYNQLTFAERKRRNQQIKLILDNQTTYQELDAFVSACQEIMVKASVSNTDLS